MWLLLCLWFDLIPVLQSITLLLHAGHLSLFVILSDILWTHLFVRTCTWRLWMNEKTIMMNGEDKSVSDGIRSYQLIVFSAWSCYEGSVSSFRLVTASETIRHAFMMPTNSMPGVRRLQARYVIVHSTSGHTAAWVIDSYDHLPLPTQQQRWQSHRWRRMRLVLPKLSCWVSCLRQERRMRRLTAQTVRAIAHVSPRCRWPSICGSAAALEAESLGSAKSQRHSASSYVSQNMRCSFINVALHNRAFVMKVVSPNPARVCKCARWLIDRETEAETGSSKCTTGSAVPLPPTYLVRCPCTAMGDVQTARQRWLFWWYLLVAISPACDWSIECNWW